MMRGAVPLLVDVRVAALARLRLHEIFRGNVAAVFGLRRAGEKLPLRSVAFAVHGRSRHSRIGNAVCVLPGDLAIPPGSRFDTSGQQEQACETDRPLRRTLAPTDTRGT